MMRAAAALVAAIIEDALFPQGPKLKRDAAPFVALYAITSPNSL